MYYTAYYQSFQLYLSIFSATNWCYCLINYCGQNKTYWETEGRQRFTEHFQQLVVVYFRQKMNLCIVHLLSLHNQRVPTARLLLNTPRVHLVIRQD
jgi:hypothetical protein